MRASLAQLMVEVGSAGQHDGAGLVQVRGAEQERHRIGSARHGGQDRRARRPQLMTVDIPANAPRSAVLKRSAFAPAARLRDSRRGLASRSSRFGPSG